MSITSFTPPFSPDAVDDLHRRLDRTRWPSPFPPAEWQQGCEREFLQNLCAYWQHSFDWKMQVDHISTFRHYRFEASGFGVHFIHEPGKGPHPIPIILTHGWPGSFLEMLRIIPLLTDPAAHGADELDSFDVVVPSLPGYGYSDQPRDLGMNAGRTADIWAALMQELGYGKFAAQGGDIGANVTTFLGLRYPERLLGLHLNYVPGSYRPYLGSDDRLTSVESDFLDRAARWRDECGGYSHIQSTRPLTAAYGLTDSPAGLAGWIVEKFREWSDCDGDVYRRFSKDELLADVTLYWMTGTVYSSFRMYYETRRSPTQFTEGQFVKTPCAVAHFPKELPLPPREWVERGYNIEQWTEMPRGGHFAAAEEPELLARDLRAFFRRFRQLSAAV